MGLDYGEQGGVELDEGGVAGGGGGRHGRGLVAIEAEEGPVALGFETRFVFYVNL